MTNSREEYITLYIIYKQLHKLLMLKSIFFELVKLKKEDSKLFPLDIDLL